MVFFCQELVQSALLESNTGRDDHILYGKLVRMANIWVGSVWSNTWRLLFDVSTPHSIVLCLFS